MAQTQEFLDEGIGELIIRLTTAEATAGTAALKIVGMTDSSACTANKSNTHASPADPLITDSGLASQAIDTVGQTKTNTTGDTATWDHVFTATATKNVTGIHITNNQNDCSYVECCFNAVIAMENTDTLTIDAQAVIDQAA